MTHDAQAITTEWGRRIAARRVLLGLSRQELADKLGFAAAKVARIERGDHGVSDADKLTIAKLDVDASPAVARDFQIMSIPTMILFQDGKPTKTIVGAKGKAALLRELDGVVGS